MKVSIICVSTLCGRIEPPGIGSHQDRLRLERARASTQASLIGASSLRKGDPEMRCPGGILPSSRIRAIVSDSGHIPGDRKIFRAGPPPLIFTSERGYRRLSTYILERASVYVLAGMPSGGLNLREAIGIMADMGVDELLVEGGGRLNYHALRQGVVDEILLTLAPKVVGSEGLALLVSGPCQLGSPFLEFELVECQNIPESDELFLTYRAKVTGRDPCNNRELKEI